MITRSNLAEQLRDYQIRSKHDWASVSFFSSTSSNITNTSKYANSNSIHFNFNHPIMNISLVYYAKSKSNRHVFYFFISIFSLTYLNHKFDMDRI